MPAKKAAVSTASSPAQVMAEMNKLYPGKIKLGSDPDLIVRHLPTGCLAFDRLVGGGIPEERYSEFFGTESTLKSTLAGMAVAAFLRAYADRDALWIDAEGSFDPLWLARFGVDTERLHHVHPEVGEQATNILSKAGRSGSFSIAVIDSIAALLPQRESEYEAEETDKAVGAAGRMNSSMMRRLTPLLQNGVTIILINQVRDTIGGMAFMGPRTKSTGGRAIPYYAGMRLEFVRGESVNQKYVKIGIGGKQQQRTKLVAREINIRVIKDKTGAREGQVASLLWRPGSGEIDEFESLLMIGSEEGLVTRKASSITIFPGNKKREVVVRGWGEAHKYLEANKPVARLLKKRIVATMEKNDSPE